VESADVTEQNRIVGVVGRKGAGKSTRVRTLIQYAPRIVAWDPMGDYDAVIPDQFDDVDDELSAYLLAAAKAKHFACAVVPSVIGDDDDADDLAAPFDRVCRLVYSHERLLFVVEEAPLICTPTYMPSAFGTMVRTGRHRSIDICWTAQRAGEVSRALTSATDIFIFYSQTEPRDLDAIADRCGGPTAVRVAELHEHESFTWDVIRREVVADSPRLLKRIA
jgi:hypothetical protein